MYSQVDCSIQNKRFTSTFDLATTYSNGNQHCAVVNYTLYAYVDNIVKLMMIALCIENVKGMFKCLNIRSFACSMFMFFPFSVTQPLQSGKCGNVVFIFPKKKK